MISKTEALKQDYMPEANGQALKPLDFTQEQIELIKRMHQATGLTDDEFMVFLHFCRRKRVDPLLKQAYAIKRRLKDGSSQVMIMTSIEGLRSIADRTHTYCPVGEPEFVTDDKNKLVAAKVTVKKFVQGEWHELKGVAYWAEFNQGNFMWDRMPRNQLAKCAEAGALRKGWPEDCGGFFVPEEFNQEQPDESEPRKERERGSLKKLKASPEENRGHGNEGLSAQRDMEIAVTTGKGTVPYDNYNTNIIEAISKANKDKKWAEVKVKDGVASIWNEQAKTYKDESIPSTTLYCWHQSLFEALMQRPKNIVLAVVNKEGSKFSPIIEDILAVGDIKYVKGRPVVEPVHPALLQGAPTKVNADRRQQSLKDLSAALGCIWPIDRVDMRPVRNKVGQAIFNLKSKDELNDLTYPQEKIDAAIQALQWYAALQNKPVTEDGIVNEVFNCFNAKLEEIRQAKVE